MRGPGASRPLRPLGAPRVLDGSVDLVGETLEAFRRFFQPLARKRTFRRLGTVAKLAGFLTEGTGILHKGMLRALNYRQQLVLPNA